MTWSCISTAEWGQTNACSKATKAWSKLRKDKPLVILIRLFSYWKSMWNKMFLTLTFHWCVVSCKFFWKKSGDFNFSNTLHSGSRNPSPFFHVLRPRPQPHLPLTSRTRVEPLANWEAHVYLKGYKDGVRFSESTSSSNPNYQILHPGFWFQLITAPVEQILKNFMMWPPGESKASKHPVNCWEQHCFTRKPSLMMSSLWITISWDVEWQSVVPEPPTEWTAWV